MLMVPARVVQNKCGNVHTVFGVQIRDTLH